MYPQSEEKYPILSIRPLWAYLIVWGGKDIENRTWRTSYRGLFYIHASKTFSNRQEKEEFYRLYPDEKIGGVIGQVELVDCVRRHPSQWAMPDHWHWVLENPRKVDFSQMKGKLGLFYGD